VCGLPERGPPLALVLGLAALGGAVQSPRSSDPFRADGPLRDGYPVAALEWTRASELHGPMLNPYPWGGFLAYFLPEHKIYIDSRTRPFADVFPVYLKIYTGTPEWRELLGEQGVEWVFLETGCDLAQLLAVDPQWRRVYSDAQAEVFVREAGPNGHLPAAPRYRPPAKEETR
jgi:hypothetical protein